MLPVPRRRICASWLSQRCSSVRSYAITSQLRLGVWACMSLHACGGLHGRGWCPAGVPLRLLAPKAPTTVTRHHRHASPAEYGCTSVRGMLCPCPCMHYASQALRAACPLSYACGRRSRRKAPQTATTDLSLF